MNRFPSKKSGMRDAVLAIAGLALYCILAYFFKIPCPISFFTGISCPGCGMTRALFSLLQLDFGAALYYHPLIYLCIIMIPVFAIVHIKKKHSAKKILLIACAVIFIAVYLYRFLILKSPVLHFTPENGIFVRLLTGRFN